MADLVDAGPDLHLPALELDAAAGRAQAQQRALSELRSTGLFVALLENPAADDAVPNGWRYLAGQVKRVLGVSLVIETRAASGTRAAGRLAAMVVDPAPGSPFRLYASPRTGRALPAELAVRLVLDKHGPWRSEPWSSLPAHCVRSHPALRANRCVGDQTRHGPPPWTTTCPVALEAVAAGVAARRGDRGPLRRYAEKYGTYHDGWVCPERGAECDAHRSS